MEKKQKRKALGISLIVIGCSMIATIFILILSWKLLAIIIGVGGGVYLAKLGMDYIEQSNQPVNEAQKPKES